MSSPEGTRTLVSRILSSYIDLSLGLDHVLYVARIPEVGSPMLSHTLRSNFLSSTMRTSTSVHLNPSQQFWAWLEIPVSSHFLSKIDFLCCSSLVETFSKVSPMCLLLQLQSILYTPGKLQLGSLLLFVEARIDFNFLELLKTVLLILMICFRKVFLSFGQVSMGVSQF